MLDCHAVLPPVDPLRDTPDDPPMGQQSGADMRLLCLELRRGTIMGDDRLMGHRDLGGAYQSMWPFALFSISMHSGLRADFDLETGSECRLPHRLFAGPDAMHTILEGTIQAQKLRPIWHHTSG